MKWIDTRRDLFSKDCPEWLNRFPVMPLRMLMKSLYLPVYAVLNSWVLKPEVLVLHYLEMPLTTRCTLRCSKCSNLMQYYSKGWDLPMEQAQKEIGLMLDTADRIYDFGLIGGESFLYPHLAELIKLLWQSKKVDQISLTTNGTVVPKDEALLIALAQRKILVKISDYGALSGKMTELIKLFDERKIRYRVMEMTGIWYDFGELHCRMRGEEELKRQFQSCASGCRSYLGGRLHFCPRSSHGTDMGIIPGAPGDYADLSHPDASRTQRRRELKKMQDIRSISACNYCDKGTALHVPIPAAEQSETMEEA